ncbi:hypothetical protein GCM10027570_48270 [Streptomonospora sediminis]
MTGSGRAVGRLRQTADRLWTHLRSTRSVDRLAYSQLAVGGERHPWTLAAQRTWEQGGGHWRTHHRAVSYHARAYDLEQQGAAEAAHEYWLAALRCWARVAADDRFWAGMRDHLAAAMGAEPPAEVLESVRAGLPRDLLEPNVTRAAELCASRPDHARLHMTAVCESGLPPEAVAAARREFAEPAVAEAVRSARAGRYGTAADTIETYLAADPANPRLVAALLQVARQAATAAGAGDTRCPVLHGFLERVASLVQPYTDRTELDERSGAEAETVREFARFEFCRGLQQRAVMLETQDDPPTAAGHARAAVAHMQRALARDPALSGGGFRREPRELLTEQYVYAAFFTQQAQCGDDAVRKFLGPALSGLGTRPGPEGRPELAPLVVARLTVPDRREQVRARAVVDHLLGHPAIPADKRRTLAGTRSLLSLREWNIR